MKNIFSNKWSLPGMLTIFFTAIFIAIFKADCFPMFDIWESISGNMSAGTLLSTAFTGGIIPWIKNEKFVSLQDDEMKDFDAEDLGAYHKALQESKEAELKALIAENNDANTEAITKLKATIDELTNTTIKSLTQALEAQGTEMSKLIKHAKDQANVLQLGNDFVAEMLKGLDERKDDIKSMIKSGKGAIVLELKASQTSADITTGQDFATLEPGVGQIATRQPFIKELFRQQPINSEFLKYNDQETVVRDAKNVAGCAASTHTSKVTWQVRTLQMTKVRDFVDVCIDMMDDYDFVTGEVNALVETDVKLRVDNQLLLGTGAHPQTNSIDAVASTFAAGSYALKVRTPTLIDLIMVAASQISDFGQNNKFNASVALVNPIDFTLMQLEKDSQGRYMIPNWITDNGVNIGSVRVIPNQLILVDEFYILDSSKGVVFQRRGVTVEMSFENNDNFEREIVTVKAYERLNLRVRNVDANAFMHIASIDAAITAITLP